MKHVVSRKWLLARLYESDLVIVDCRFVMGQPDAGRAAYEESHIPGAVYLDLERDLSAPVEEDGQGGRHPLPDAAELAGRLSRVGIGNDSRVVAYDDQGGAMASRLWWLLRYLGHENVFVLDEGFSAWKKGGYPVNADQKVLIPSTFLATVQHSMLVEMEEVQESLGGEERVLVDSREAPRYRGEVEPLDKKAGHIPGARNKFWKGVLQEDGSFKSPEALAEHFADLPRDKELVVYCGSGVTATPNVLALSEAGFEKVKLYAGSWSDWISYAANPIATRDE
ncbi:sulfurtransferase [Cohnella thailandensis]|uniref:Sulfurtransferase n=1 Tax=Cohnella thailandensis TaxID=557557 RepID=A0A841ST54_9BACL|nr:sulfurtransferase [Cohnella thailandensis]MBB6633225.1 sulfurtransferase [Cohnella thailandensis]MBP1975079.1 thiosulfate/3-mercaptopyruvate sulfurtransferase [Cohnella thailandensis]